MDEKLLNLLLAFGDISAD